MYAGLVNLLRIMDTRRNVLDQSHSIFLNTILEKVQVSLISQDLSVRYNFDTWFAQRVDEVACS